MSRRADRQLVTDPLDRDERAVRWRITDTVYVVDFWHRLPPPPGGDLEKQGHKQDSFRVSGADSVEDVLSWARGNAEGRSFVVYVQVKAGGERGIVQIHGIDPTVPAR
jgi:hypothetical protein